MKSFTSSYLVQLAGTLQCGKPCFGWQGPPATPSFSPPSRNILIWTIFLQSQSTTSLVQTNSKVARSFPAKSLRHSLCAKSSQPQVLVQQITRRGAREPQCLQLRVLEPAGVSAAFPTQLFMPISTVHHIHCQL